LFIYKVGPEFPCEPDGQTWKSCLDCNKTFESESCYKNHLKYTCKISKRCLDCKVIYNVKVNKRNERAGHVCGDRFCRKCYRKLIFL